jgi:peptide/nickel transport system permease protein
MASTRSGLSAYLLHRLLAVVPVVFGVTVLVFLVMHLAPGDPAQLMLGQNATPESLQLLRTELGLDRPIPQQYALWLGRVARGDLGRSLSLGRPVLP